MMSSVVNNIYKKINFINNTKKYQLRQLHSNKIVSFKLALEILPCK